MKLTQGLIAISLSVPAAFATGPARAATDCIALVDSRPGDWCTGQLAPLRVSVRNDCESPKRVGFTFALDQEPIRAKKAAIVPADDTISETVLLTLPPALASGRHTLTVKVTDAAGNVVSRDQRVTVGSCAVP
jgi:hypothetical protein